MQQQFRVIMTLTVLSMLAVSPLPAATLADRLLASYDAVQTMTCEIRRDTEAGGQRVRFLSRIAYARPDRLNVENVEPLARRIVADGTNFFSYADGDPKGFSRPIARLDKPMLDSLRKLPGTAMDHLFQLSGVAETNLPGTADNPVRRGYATPKVFAVLNLDPSGRLARIEFFTSSTCQTTLGKYDYSDFIEAAPGVWIARMHKGGFSLGKITSRETLRVTALTVNQPIPPAMFIAAPFFRRVEFASTFDAIYDAMAP
ncbi:MAG: hypothetical protein WCL16_02410 [bacterium]